MLSRISKEDERLYLDLVKIHPYLKRALVLKKNAIETDDQLIDDANKTDTAILKDLPKNVRESIIKLNQNFVASQEELSTMIKYLDDLHRATDPIQFFRTTQQPALLLQLKRLQDFKDLNAAVFENQAIANKWKTRMHYLQNMTDTLTVLERQLDFPGSNIIFGLVKHPLSMAQKGMHLWSNRYDPLGSKEYVQGITALHAVSVITATIGLSAVIAGGAVTGVALAPISLFIYAAVSSANELIKLFKSVKDLIKEFSNTLPENTYRLRIMKRVNDVVHTAAAAAFKILLAIMAFIAIANPLGLVVAGTVITGFAISTMAVGLASLVIKKQIDKQIKVNALKDAEAHISPKPRNPSEELSHERKLQSEFEHPTAEQRTTVEPNATSERRGEKSTSRQNHLLTGYGDYVDPKPKLLGESAKETAIDIQALKNEIQEAAAEQGVNLSVKHTKETPEKFSLVKNADASQGKPEQEIATVHCKPTSIECTFRHLKPTAVEEAEFVNDIRPVLMSLNKTDLDSLQLKGGNLREVLLIYQTALEVGLTKIRLDSGTETRLEQLHAGELKLLKDQQNAMLHPKNTGDSPSHKVS